jgi:hypothetical protein
MARVDGGASSRTASGCFSMKLWLTLIFGTILISFAMTYLVMHQGAQTLPDASEKEVEFTTPSRAEFGLGRIDANVLVVEGGTSYVGKVHSVSIPVKCTGTAPLRIELLRITCACVDKLLFNGKELEEKKPVMVNPGETATFKISWKPKEAQTKEPLYRFRLVFLMNDLQYSPTFNIEVETQVLLKEGAS